MAWQSLHRSEEQDQALDRILAHVGSRRGDLAILDLDGTLVDNRPREIRILREYAHLHAAWDLLQVEPRHIWDWDLGHVLSNAGLPPERAGALLPPLQSFWDQRFFLGAYASFDEPLPGASDFVRRLEAAGAPVVYLSGRMEECRPATARFLEQFGFPRGRLLLRPDDQEGIRSFKERSLASLAREGRPGLFLEDIPSNLTAFACRYPEALLVWLATGQSHLAHDLPPGALTLKGFLTR